MTVMKLFRAKSFRKDYQKLKISDKQHDYIKYLSLLLGEQSLPAEARDHNLIGNYLDSYGVYLRIHLSEGLSC